ncbi:T9SS type A sorting domain-containing protein [candidate division WOR-3 bacterium]|nr:T9SS type A sorting domain-containing protein [candidate division WOR-3 bacterium]MCK4333204.1 T9SS type A sorting domain-containing protein [candidate division WOR-3 bacterium]
MTSFVAEEPAKETPTLWTPLSPIGNKIVLLYHNNPEGLHAQVFDATGRKVNEVHADGSSGTITWGEDQRPGVYFIRVESGVSRQMQKVVLIR